MSNSIEDVENIFKNFESDMSMYEVFCKDARHQISFIDDVYEFDFDYLQGLLENMKLLQKKIIDNG